LPRPFFERPDDVPLRAAGSPSATHGTWGWPLPLLPSGPGGVHGPLHCMGRRVQRHVPVRFRRRTPSWKAVDPP